MLDISQPRGALVIHIDDERQSSMHDKPERAETEPTHNFARRHLLLVGVPAAVGLLGMPKDAHAAPVQLNVNSPKNGFVLEVLATDGSTIAAGAPVVRLEDTVEQRALSRLAAIRQALAIVEERLSNDSVATDRKRADLAINVAKARADAAEERIRMARGAIALGVLPETPRTNSVAEYGRKDWEADYIRTTAAYQDAVLAKADLEAKIDRARRALAVAKDQLSNEEKAASFRETTVILKAPISGKIKVLCAPSQFVTEGAALAQIHA